jgi:hypothetical protein
MNSSHNVNTLKKDVTLNTSWKFNSFVEIAMRHHYNKQPINSVKVNVYCLFLESQDIYKYNMRAKHYIYIYI